MVLARVMPFYHDPTEARRGSRLPQDISNVGQPLPGLERYTGADLLLSPLKVPSLMRVSEAIPHQLALRRHCEAGLLVQRKTGRDLVSSIPRLAEIEAKMLSWTARPWLLFVGRLGQKDGEAVVDGQSTGFRHSSVVAALDAWQLRGGYVTVLNNDGMIAPWLAVWLDRLRAWEPEKLVRPKQQALVGPESGNPWRSTLVTFPGVGLELATRIAKYAGSLKASLMLVSNSNSLHLPGKPKGFGPKTLRACREWLGLEDDEMMYWR